MKKSIYIVGLFTLLIMAVIAAFVIWGVPYFFGVSLPEPTQTGFGSETVRARVARVIEEGLIDLGGIEQPYQIMQVEILEGEYQGVLIEVDYGRRQVRPEGMRFGPGDEILITLGLRQDNLLVAYYADAVRWRPLLVLFGVFVAATLLISRWKGLRSLLALAFSLLVIVGYIIPHILAGEDPVRVSIIGSVILLGVTLYLTYGWNLKTHAAVASMVLVLVVTGTLAYLFVVFTRLTGVGTEEALFLFQVPGLQVNLRGLVLGGMIIGALGVLDDLVTTQAAAVFELHATDPTLGLKALFARAMRIGRDHVAATVNTLVLAYAGASLPMLLLFTLARGNYAYLVNLETVAEEIVRTLVGSLGLIAAVPLSTLVAAALALHADHLGWLRDLLGPADGHDHSHGSLSHEEHL
ncbi:MAG: YibE/F family protein [Anaerolineales bacterium]|nr:YibE/F family protein [Anaerolineales bacterium]